MNFKKLNKVSRRKGFTLIEILIVIGIIAILAAIVIIAINPAKQFAQARNTQRTANVNALLNAVGQRLADNKGIFAGSYTVGSNTYTCGQIPTNQTTITTDMASNTTSTTGDLGCLIPTYMSDFPIDPSGPASPSTGYEISVNSTGRIKVCAPKAATETAVPGAAAICMER